MVKESYFVVDVVFVNKKSVPNAKNAMHIYVLMVMVT